MAHQEEPIGPRRLISTKFHPPQLRTDIIHRQELTQRIEQNISSGVVVISAPAGFGKTTLASEWASQTRFPLVWITLDRQDNSTQTFMQTFYHALQYAMPDTPGLDSDILHPFEPSRSIQKDVIEFINESEKNAVEFVIVLDNLHFISDKPIIEAINFLVDHLPPNMHILLISRGDPDIAFARLRARNRLTEIRIMDLRFSDQECKQFLNHTMKLKLSQEEINILVKHSEGWVTGLQLAAISMQHKQPVADISGLISGDNTYVLDFLVEEVYEQQSEALQNFLLRTSILEMMTGPLCEALLDDDAYTGRGQDLLHELYHQNLFITTLDNREHWYRYHPLFAESLQHLLAEKIPTQIAGLHRLASRWYLENDLPEYAIRHALSIDDYECMMEVIEHSAGALVSSEGILTVLKWIDIIPDELIRSKPEMCILYAWGMTISFETEAARYWLETACRSLDIPYDIWTLDDAIIESYSPEKLNLLGQVFAIESILAAQHGKGHESNRLSQKAMQLLQKENIILQNYLLMEQCLTSMLDMDLVNLDHDLKELIRISKVSGFWMVSVIARCYKGRSQTMRGQLSKAWDTYQQAVQFTIDSYGKIMPFTGFINCEMSAIQIERNHLSEAMLYLAQGIEISQDWFPVVLSLQARLRMAYLKYLMGDFNGARQEIKEAYLLANTTDNEFDDLLISIMETKLGLYHGDWRQCLNWAQRQGFLDKSPARSSSHLPFTFSAYIQTNLARMWLWRSRSEKAPEYANRSLEILHDLMTCLDKRGCLQMQIEVLTLQALAYQGLDEMDHALSTLEQAFQYGEPEGFRRTFLDEGIYLARLTARLLAHIKKEGQRNIFPTQEYIVELLSLFNTTDIEPLSGMEDHQIKNHNTRSETISSASEHYAIDLLTPREKEVLYLVAQGSSNAEIAQELYLALNTVKRHLNNIFLKLGASTRTQAVAIARKLNIIE